MEKDKNQVQGTQNPNDQRSDALNPNSPSFKASQDNRSSQLNPQGSKGGVSSTGSSQKQGIDPDLDRDADLDKDKDIDSGIGRGSSGKKGGLASQNSDINKGDVNKSTNKGSLDVDKER